MNISIRKVYQSNSLIKVKMEIQTDIKADKKVFKIVAISDTHGRNQQMLKLIENNQSGDIFIHAGDFTRYGREQNFDEFFLILQKLNFRHKIIIAGNHEVMLDQNMNPLHKEKKLLKYPCKYTRNQIIERLKKHSIYLEHQFVEIEGIKIFGSPYSKKYGKAAFQYEQKFQELIWKDIPHVDILITHSPPYGILDKADSGKRAGSESLKKKIFQIKPKIHFFGHIHEGKGHLKKQQIDFYNLSKQLVLIQKEF